MKKNLRNAIIILIFGVLTSLITMGVFSYFLHQGLWGRSSIRDILSIWLAASLTPTSFGLLIVGSIGLYKQMKVKKLTFALVMITIYVAPIAMLGIYRYVDQQIYNSTYAFSVEKWANASEDDRSHMIRFFRKEHDLVEQDLNYAVSLLGEPDREEDLKYYYSLGLVEAVLVTNEIYYFIEFDSRNIITNESILKVPHNPDELDQ